MRLITLSIIILGFAWAPSAYAESANACVTCHASLAPSARRAHDFSEWQGSIHARAGVMCEKCHGGNPGVSDAAGAHAGVVPATQKGSPLYYMRIQDTCGTCHGAEAAEFKKSFHFSELKRTGRGPTCTTCHGSMATAILTPVQMEQQCSLCHVLRGGASQALVTLNQADAAVKRWAASLAKAAPAGKAGTAEEAILKAQQSALAEAKRKWHSLDMSDVLNRARSIIQAAQAAMQGLQLKSGGAR
ncbi:MAG: ammonia-forming cytochrome c nitrite reductase subunit c552 [Deltaproteobacteria bacterium]|nr:ammonia-forming cytochrome c nitrite reductase subunit c552 [Deltaproteobacteria bacterium]